MLRPIVILLVGTVLAFFNLSCSVNLLSTFADKTTDESLYWDANTDIKNGDYNSALTKIGDMSSTYQASAPVLRLKSSAYGGLCGVNFFTFVQQLSSMGATRLMPFLLQSFDASSGTNIDACINAQNTLLSIGSITERSDDDNFMIVVFSFAKIGQILSYYTDKTKTGSASATFDACLVGTTRTNPVAGNEITDSDARELGTGLSLAAANLSAVAGKIAAGSGSLTAISNVCSALPAGFNFCAVTDPTAFSANEVKGIRSLVKEGSAVGLGVNGCTGDVTVCNCP